MMACDRRSGGKVGMREVNWQRIRICVQVGASSAALRLRRQSDVSKGNAARRFHKAAVLLRMVPLRPLLLQLLLLLQRILQVLLVLLHLQLLLLVLKQAVVRQTTDGRRCRRLLRGGAY